MNTVKSTIKKLLIANEDKKYNKLVGSKKMDYNKWISCVESGFESQNNVFLEKMNCQTIDENMKRHEGLKNENDRELAEYGELCKLYTVYDTPKKNEIEAQYLVVDAENASKACKIVEKSDYNRTFVILKLCDGKLSNFAISKIHEEILKNESLIVIYSDEDELDDAGNRMNPWYKPDWAPDDFLSGFYFGSMVGIRLDALESYELNKEKDIYRLLYKILLLNGAFDKHKKIIGKEDIYNNGIVAHIPEVLYHTLNVTGYDRVKELKLEGKIHEKVQNDLISVIIPSKDHPEILFKCIDSFIDRTVSSILNYEFIVVDNGSSENNRKTIEELLNNYKKANNVSNVEYIYEKCDFNFSYMCNRGAKEAKGKYLLFLNDDMEIIEPDWLDKLYFKAITPYAGAVGAKLLYPPSIKDGRIIQHAGITNLKIGPAHKLQFMSDDANHYYGRNIGCHDMIGVTGACLLVKKSIFDEVGGFDKELAVAFNDVDLCFKIYEAGYYNIVRNDVILYHHESLSRGNDADSSEKMIRLSKEKDKLYEKHQIIYGNDPFYNKNLTTDMLETEYAPKYHYEVKLEGNWAKIEDITDVINASRQDRCVKVGMECAMDIYKWKYGVSLDKGTAEPKEEDLGYYFQGYTFVIGSNNACFDRTLLLKNTETNRVYGVEVSYEYRPDIRKNLSDQVNVDLTGYTAKISKNSIPDGNYQFGMYMKDKTSSLRIYNWSNWSLDTNGSSLVNEHYGNDK